MGWPPGQGTSASASAVELPRALVVPSRRRRRPLLGVSGLVLFACLFLPAVEGCGRAPVIPLDAPPFWAPYLYGLVFAGIAAARTHRHLAAGVFALRVLAVFVVLAGLGVAVVAPALGAAEITVGVALIVAVGGGGEARVAATAAVFGGAACAWFAAWADRDGALYGVHVALGASAGLAIAGLAWSWDLARVLRYARSS